MSEAQTVPMTEAPSVHRKHQYHLVEPSIWPLLGALSAGAMFLGAVLGMHDKGWWLAIVGFGFVLATMFLWFKDVVHEAQGGHHHSPVVQIGLRYGMTLFITSEVMFFVAFFWAFFASSIHHLEAPGGTWPPTGIVPFTTFHLPFLNTLVLLLSGTTVTWAHHALIEGDRRSLVTGLALTVLLGLSFTGLQALEYSHALFHFSGNIFGATFFMATGFHGFHVMVGTIFLAVCLFRAWRGDFKPDHHFGFEAAAWYWHFVDVVWIFLFVCVYWWGGSGAAITE
jgi:cytochrome c oxidase subunit III